ncbi:MAG: hypothetical protein O3A46_07175 [Candidatus Poribacteria bacterium]|nr:hypothetical protein [Candidatus Poribacteria bacterium]
MHSLKQWLVLLTVAFGLIGPTSAFGQSAYGPGGLFLIPSAYNAPKDTVSFGSMFGYQHMWAKPAPHRHYLFQNAVGYAVSDDLTIGFTQIVMRKVTHRPSWGVHGKYTLLQEEGNHPAIAISAVWIPVWHWHTESVALTVSKGFDLTDDLRLQLHAGAMHAWWMNGIKTDKHPYDPSLASNPHLVDYTLIENLHDPARPISRQKPFGGVDLQVGKYVKLTAEARARMISDHPDAIPGMVGIVFTPHKYARVGFAYGTDGLGDEQELKIGIGYNISTVE